VTSERKLRLGKQASTRAAARGDFRIDVRLKGTPVFVGPNGKRAAFAAVGHACKARYGLI
jgi:hypothetical protein